MKFFSKLWNCRGTNIPSEKKKAPIPGLCIYQPVIEHLPTEHTKNFNSQVVLENPSFLCSLGLLVGPARLHNAIQTQN